MLLDATRTFGTLNFGGSTATTVSFVVGTAEEV
jgi:acetyl-CoA C-acetyltransferase